MIYQPVTDSAISDEEFALITKVSQTKTEHQNDETSKK